MRGLGLQEPNVHCTEGKPPGAAAGTRPQWTPQALWPGSLSLLKYLWEQCRSPEGPGWLPSLGATQKLGAKFVLLGGGMLRIELNQMEDDMVPLGSQAHKPRVLRFPAPPPGPPQSTAWNSPEQPVSTFSDSQKEPCGVEPS